ncbi:dimethyladenosine transferase 1, mitochondrial-like [Portunus trituberculatus]|uniref:dimethyladenosine transferase 1, mitochondrial-like n=1 Tax=Portunus trituberculatus TaxID=210409 RepID=UPI001E1CEA71|nr:dimethyladenosine transferase 1, mitochondrial-like [Portunus trituberculatus]
MGPLRLPPLPTTGELLRLYKLRALKQLSQNFLLDPKLCSKLVRAAGRLRGARVCEVGPGPGNLTRAILHQGAAKVTVVEKDVRFLPTLEALQDVSGGCLDVCVGDVLSFNMEKIFASQDSPACTWEDPPPRAHIIGNLPFSVATPLTIGWLEDISLRRNAWVEGRTRLTLTYQLEVAQRMAAPPGHHQRSRLSLMCQNWCHVRHCFTIPGRAFVPPPDVDVGVVQLTPHVAPHVPLPFPVVEKVARCLFSFRQKYCQRGLGTLFPKGVRDALLDKLLKVADVEPTLRPFQITMKEFARLCHTYQAILDQHPHLAKYNYRDPASDDMIDDIDNNIHTLSALT